LAKRAKAAEKAFFDIYKTMADIPDPLPILEQSVERNQQLSSKCQDAEIEINSIRETMSDQAKEIAELKSKEKKMLELQALVAQYDKNIDETMKEKLAGEIERVKADFEDRLLRIEEEKDQLTKKCKEAEMTSVSTHHLLEQAQSDLYEANLKLHQKSDAKSDEIEMVFLLTSVHRAIVEIVGISSPKNLGPALSDSLSQLSCGIISSTTFYLVAVRCTVCESMLVVGDPVLFIICILNQLRV